MFWQYPSIRAAPTRRVLTYSTNVPWKSFEMQASKMFWVALQHPQLVSDTALRAIVLPFRLTMLDRHAAYILAEHT